MYVLFIAFHMLSSAYANQYSNIRYGGKSDGLNGGRARRSLPKSAIDRVYENARLITPHLRKIRVFDKTGGKTTALNDFNAFAPSRVTKMGNVQSGISGNKQVILTLEERRPFMEVQYYAQGKLGGAGSPIIRTDIIRYIEKEM